MKNQNRIGTGLVGLLAFAGLVLSASSAGAVPMLYDLTGSTITVTSSSLPAPLVQPVTGSMTLDDDGLGNVSMIGDLAINFTVEVHQEPFVAGSITTDITVDLSGTGTRSGDTLAFANPISWIPDGTVFCETTASLNLCAIGGLAVGENLIPESTPGETFERTFEDLTFGPGDLTFTIADTTISPDGDATTQVLMLQGTLVPEPTTALLMGLGLAGLGAQGRRRA